MAIQNSFAFEFKEFQSYTEYKKFHISMEDSSNYEIISGKQSLYFDFDGEFDFDILTSRIREKFKDEKIQVTLYSSCDAVKKSYHVIVKGIYFKDHVDCGIMAMNLASDLPSFDACVYTSKRNLRLLGSRKINSTRVKKFDRVLYKSPSYKCRYEDDPLYMSLVTGIADSKLFEMGEIYTIPKREFQTAQLSEIEVVLMMEKVNTFFPHVFTKREVSGNSITLKRVMPFVCLVCDRKHDNENASVFKRGNSIMFRCFRNPTTTIELDNDSEIEIPIISEEEIVHKKVIKEKPDFCVKFAEKLRFLHPFSG
jgi:hypothetical protein